MGDMAFEEQDWERDLFLTELVGILRATENMVV
jgi:hypothetical protein